MAALYVDGDGHMERPLRILLWTDGTHRTKGRLDVLLDASNPSVFPNLNWDLQEEEVPHLERRRLRLREAQGCAQGHTAKEGPGGVTQQGI